jgi:hypothetical protein
MKQVQNPKYLAIKKVDVDLMQLEEQEAPPPSPGLYNSSFCCLRFLESREALQSARPNAQNSIKYYTINQTGISLIFVSFKLQKLVFITLVSLLMLITIIYKAFDN